MDALSYAWRALVEGLMVAELAEGGCGSGFEVFGRRDLIGTTPNDLNDLQNNQASSFIRSAITIRRVDIYYVRIAPSTLHAIVGNALDDIEHVFADAAPPPSSTPPPLDNASFSGYTTSPTSPSTRNKRHTSRPFPNADAAYYPLRRARLFPKPSGAPTRRHRVHWTSIPNPCVFEEKDDVYYWWVPVGSYVMRGSRFVGGEQSEQSSGVLGSNAD